MAVLYLLFWVLKLVSTLSTISLYYVAIIFQSIGFLGFGLSLASNNELLNNTSYLNYGYQNNVSYFVGIVYGMFTIFFLVRLMIGFKNLYHPTTKKITVSISLNKYVDDVVNTYLPNKKVVIRWVDDVVTIFTYGFIKPVIVLPIACVNNLTEDELASIILHEIAHIKYAHFMLNIWVEVVSAVLWFNPFNYWLHKEINFYREASADAFVLQQTNNQFIYANGLYKLALQTITPQQIIALPAVYTQNQLLKRIELFTKQKLALKVSAKPFIIALFSFIFLVGLDKLSTSHKLTIEPKQALVQVNNQNKSIVVSTKENKIEKRSKQKVVVKTKRFAPKISTKEESIYQLDDKKELAQSLKYLSELAIKNPILQSIISNNPTITPVALKEDDNTQKVRRFIIPPTPTKGAVLIKVTVEEKPNNKPKVTIELEEQALIEAS